jgi:hypothetical protein
MKKISPDETRIVIIPDNPEIPMKNSSGYYDFSDFRTFQESISSSQKNKVFQGDFNLKGRNLEFLEI